MLPREVSSHLSLTSFRARFEVDFLQQLQLLTVRGFLSSMPVFTMGIQGSPVFTASWAAGRVICEHRIAIKTLPLLQSLLSLRSCIPHLLLPIPISRWTFCLHVFTCPQEAFLPSNDISSSEYRYSLPSKEHRSVFFFFFSESNGMGYLGSAGAYLLFHTHNPPRL